MEKRGDQGNEGFLIPAFITFVIKAGCYQSNQIHIIKSHRIFKRGRAAKRRSSQKRTEYFHFQRPARAFSLPAY